jgi:hypothetical protein
MLRTSNHNEPHFHYLQKSGTLVSACVRDLLEKWFENYPVDHKSELRQRFVKSKSDIASPTFEFALHATFKQLGADVEIHPKVSDDTDRRPDFLVRLPSGFEFYLEAVLARGQSDEERNRVQIVNTLYATIDQRLKSPDYFWTVTVLEQGPAAPSGKQMVHALAQYMAGLKRDEVEAQLEVHGLDTPVKLLWEDAGWSIEFVPTPKKDEAIGNPAHRPLCPFPMKQGVICSDAVDIRKNIKSKVKHHSSVDKPYIIAVNAMNLFADHKDFEDAIYGSEKSIFRTDQDGSTTVESTRGHDGIRRDKDAVKNQHLFAVIGAVCLDEWSVAGCSLTVYENPYIEMPVEARIEGLPRLELNEGHMVPVAGQTLGQLFGLPDGWPREEPSDDADR